MYSKMCKVPSNPMLPKFQKLTNFICQEIATGAFKYGDKLPSIVDASAIYDLSKDTVLKTYKQLMQMGVITSIYRKGYYVGRFEEKQTVVDSLILVDELTSANRLFYQSLYSLAKKKGVNVKIVEHHNDLLAFKRVINNNMGQYQKYVVDTCTIANTELQKFFSDKLLLSQILTIQYEEDHTFESVQTIYLNLKQDMNRLLNKVFDHLSKYDKLTLVLPERESFPYQIIKGFFEFSDTHGKNGVLLEEIDKLEKGTAYFVMDENTLFKLLRLMNTNKYELGTDIGLVTLYNRQYLQYTSKRITSINWFHESLVEAVINMIIGTQKEHFINEGTIQLGESL